MLSFSLGTAPVPARAATSPARSEPASAAAKAASTATAAGPLTREVFGFAFGNASLADPTYGYPAWSFNLLSTVAYFGLDIRWDGSISPTGAGWTTWNSSALTGMVTTAHAAHTRVILSVDLQDFSGSPSSTMCAALHPLHRAVTVQQALAQVAKMHVDGVNFDFEGVNATCAYGATTRAEMTSLVKEMRAAMPAGMYLSVDTYGGSAADPYNFFDVHGMAPYVDAFFVMAYDMEYSNQYRSPLSCAGTQALNCLGPTAPISAYYYNDTTVMAQYVAAAGAGKVILGVPYYGRKACVASGSVNARPTSTVVADDYLSASQESTDPSVLAGSYSTHRDKYTGVERWDTWYNTSLRCTRELYWDDVYSLGRKYDLALRDGLRGVGLFALQYGGGAPELWNLLAARFTTWSASYDVSHAPAGWQPGRPQTFNITVTNTSPATWPAAGTNFTALHVHFATASGGIATKSSWLGGVTVRLPADVPAGQSVTLPVTLTAPNTAGQFWLEAEMYRNQLYWLTARADLRVQVARTLWAAAYDVAAAPDSWFGGQTQAFTINVRNTGNQTWRAADPNPVMLDVSFAPAASGVAGIKTWLASQSFKVPVDVAPGQSAAIAVKVTAPTKGGAMFLQAQMFKYHQFWFGSSQPAAVTVADPWSATYDVSAVPTSWTAGQNQTFTVTVTNTGDKTWPAAGTNNVALDVHFTTAAGGTAKMSSWLSSQIFKLPADVAPGQSAAVAVAVKAPAETGPLYIETQLFKNRQFWFASLQPVPVTVAAQAWMAAYQQLSRWPLAWAGGQTQSFTVVVKNTGRQTWTATGAGHVALDMHFTAAPGAGGWLTSQVFALPADLAPGQTALIPVSVTAPVGGGHLYLEGSMFKDHQFWFPLAEPVQVAVAPTVWWDDASLAAAPLAWKAAQTQSFTVTVKNTGTEMWSATGSNPVALDLHFTPVAGGSRVVSSWTTSQVFALPADVPPGQSVQIAVSVTAPGQLGLLFLEAQLFKQKQFWMQPWQPVAVTVG